MSITMAYLRCLQSVKAAADDGELERKRVKPADLDVYFEPLESPVLAQEPAPYALQKHVSTVRKQIWKIADGTVNTFRNAKTRILNVKDGVINTYEEAKSNPLSMLRPGCITAAIIAGTIVPGRGKKRVLRLASGTLGGTLAAGVAYPHKTLQIATGVYNKTKDVTTSLVEIMKKRAEDSRAAPSVHDENATKHANHTAEVITASLGEGEFPEPEEEKEMAPKGVVQEKIQGDTAVEITSESSLPTAVEEGKKDLQLVKDVTTATSENEIKIAKNFQGEDVCLIDILAEEEAVGLKEISETEEGENVSHEELVSAGLKDEEMLESNFEVRVDVQAVEKIVEAVKVGEVKNAVKVEEKEEIVFGIMEADKSKEESTLVSAEVNVEEDRKIAEEVGIAETNEETAEEDAMMVSKEEETIDNEEEKCQSEIVESQAETTVEAEVNEEFIREDTLVSDEVKPDVPVEEVILEREGESLVIAEDVNVGASEEGKIEGEAVTIQVEEPSQEAALEQAQVEVVDSTQNSSTEIEANIPNEENISETSKKSGEGEWVVVDVNEVPVVNEDSNENSGAAESTKKHDIILEDSSNELNDVKEDTKPESQVDYGQSNPEDKDMYSTRG